MTDADPRVEAVATALYENPPGWLSHTPDWSQCPESARASWRKEARRVVAALEAVGVIVGSSA